MPRGVPNGGLTPNKLREQARRLPSGSCAQKSSRSSARSRNWASLESVEPCATR
jgi:hypothetical protein